MKVSIITVVLNNQDFLREAIESVLHQSYKNIEYIIVDGGSNDGSLNIIQQYGNQITKIISEPDNGIYDAMNKGIALATGEVIGGDRGITIPKPLKKAGCRLTLLFLPPNLPTKNGAGMFKS